MRTLLTVLLLSLLMFGIARAAFSVDLYEASLDNDANSCFFQEDYDDETKVVYRSMNVRAGQYETGYEKNATQTLRYAKDQDDVFSYVTVYIEVCPNKQDSAAYVAQVTDQLNNLQTDTVTIWKVWLSVTEQKPNGVDDVCWYGSSDMQYVEKNIESIRNAVLAAAASGYHTGIRTSVVEWAKLTGNNTEFSQLPLLWIERGSASLTRNWQPFGGWQAPAVRQYATGVVQCNRTVNINYGEAFYCSDSDCDESTPCCAGRSNEGHGRICVDKKCVFDEKPNTCVDDKECSSLEKCDENNQCSAMNGQRCGVVWEEIAVSGQTCYGKGCDANWKGVIPAGQTCCQQMQCVNSTAPAFVDCGLVCGSIFGNSALGHCGDSVSLYSGPDCVCTDVNTGITGTCKNITVPASVARDYNCDACECVGKGTIQCYGCCHPDSLPPI